MLLELALLKRIHGCDLQVLLLLTVSGTLFLPSFNVSEELSDSRHVVFGKLLDVVVAGKFDVIWREGFVASGFIEGVPVRNGYDFVAKTVNDVGRTVDILDSVNVWEFVEWQRPSEIWADHAEG